ncbi:MAG: hypothetical protein CVV24_08335 [Ignavibacteriae bacterium HGW-Ignavibacteriae-3]|nr:MAG: hypothetical protein CVV24_08335 [Ignavibacteriae bacterium HGW-Ignavibacteriae-3]
MKLREISVTDAKAKLLKRGFELKESGKEEKSESGKEQTSLQIWNTVCPVQGAEVDTETPTVEYKGKVIGFCCPGCDAKFKKDPEKYIKNLSDDGTKFIATK